MLKHLSRFVYHLANFVSQCKYYLLHRHSLNRFLRLLIQNLLGFLNLLDLQVVACEELSYHRDY
jgi:hypothetical protein